jgi:hypothetical protein
MVKTTRATEGGMARGTTPGAIEPGATVEEPTPMRTVTCDVPPDVAVPDPPQPARRSDAAIARTAKREQEPLLIGCLTVLKSEWCSSRKSR